MIAWLHTPAPARRLAALRILVCGFAAVFLLARLPSYWSAAALPRRQWDPVGVLAAVGSPPATAVARLALVVTITVGVAAAAGWRWRITGPAFALLFLCASTFRMSWGHVIHTEHLVTLHLLIITLAPAADVWAIGAPRRRSVHTGAGEGRTEPEDSDRYGVPIRLMAIALVVTYVLAGWMKIRNGGSDWMTGDVLRNQIAYDNLRKELLGSPHSPIGGWVVGQSWLFHPIAWITVAVEIGAPLALLGGRIRTLWALAAWGFHVGIVVLMAISFPYPLSFIAYASLFRAERPVGAAGRWVARLVRREPRVVQPAGSGTLSA